jgi:predicted NodU family carbamoyl transferase
MGLAPYGNPKYVTPIKEKLPHTKYQREELPDVIAELLGAGKVIGLHQGRMEFGPRALGARSIVADARSPGMQSLTIPRAYTLCGGR